MRKENIQLGCYEYQAIYRSKMGLFIYIRSVHEEMKVDCNQCDYRAITLGNHTTHMKKYMKE